MLQFADKLLLFTMAGGAAMFGAVTGYLISMRNTGVIFGEGRSVASHLLTIISLAPKGILLGAISGALLAVLVYGYLAFVYPFNR